MPADRFGYGAVEPLLQPLRPGVAIADLRRAVLAFLVAFRALRVDHLLSGALRLLGGGRARNESSGKQDRCNSAASVQ
ncbi:hypothetical protein D3C83_53400 [compost metagenome]